jgi:chromosome segregation ATPase
MMEKKLMEKKQLIGKSLLSGRGSVAWDNPELCSTKIRNTLSGQGEELGLIKNGRVILEQNNQNATIQEETAFITVNDATDVQETTVIDQRYDGLLNVIESLKEQLIAEKQKNLKLERKTETLEKEVRAELCEEFNQMMVEIESGWEKRLQEEKDRASELSDWRINKVQEAMMESRKKRKLSEQVDSESEARALETKAYKIKELESKLEEEKKQKEQLESQIDAMKEIHQKIMEDQNKEREKLTRQSFEMANQQKKFKDYEETISRLNAELKATNEALVAQSAEPKIKELEQQIEEYKKNMLVLQQEKKDLESLLDEAGEEYQFKETELSALKDQLVLSKNTVTENELRISDLDNEIQECRALLDEANSRVEEKEFVIEEKDVQISVLEERGIELEKQISNIRSEHEQQDNDRWSLKKATEQQLSELNDETERLKEEKKRLKHQLDKEQTLHTATKSQKDKL